MSRIRHQSSVLAATEFIPDAAILIVEFVSGERYQYSGVPLHLYQQLLQAHSLGTFFNACIRNQSLFSRLGQVSASSYEPS
jgi:hypothetical protein